MEHNDTQNIFHQYPIFGFICAVFMAIVGRFAPLLDHHIPALIMDCLQGLAWLSAFGVFLISVHGWYKKNKK